MNCADFERRIAADEAGDPAVAEHLRTCCECRAFAQDLEQNAVALRSIEVDAAAYTALRARVMAAVQPKRRWGWVWVAGTAIATAIAAIWVTAPLRVPEPPRPQAVVYRINTQSVVRMAAVKLKKRVRRPVPKQQQQLAAIKLLTDDPNVVIIWLVDGKKGDSL